MVAPKKELVIDTLVLAFSRSRLRDVVGTDALRSVLDIQYRDMVRGNELLLQPLWSLLSEQPGFDADAAKPPLARFKRLEGKLGVVVTLPEAMVGLGEVELMSLAGGCEVSETDLEKLVRQHDPAAQAELASKRAAALDAADAVERKAARASSRGPLVIVAAVIALAAFGFTGWQVYRAVSAPAASFDQLKVDLGLPAASSVRRGAEAVVTLVDDTWLRKPVAEREAAMSGALQRAAASGINVLVVKNKAGVVKATAQFFKEGGQRTVRVRFL
jgi:hypothetical protein